MPRFRPALLAVAAVALAGCGSGDTSSTEPTTASHRYFGDHPGQQATALRISASDCRQLAIVVARQVRHPVQHQSEPTAPNSRCQIHGGDGDVSISLDAAYAARQRYSNRMAEQVQFNAADPTKVPHAVPGVGDRSAYNHYASWIPAYSTLYAVRGNRWITLSYAVAGETRPQRLAAAAALARRAFSLTAR
ncbi:MAG TPA: hypothetical protein VFX35_10970 [Solirubrobacterales bacterium]|nr:hypothetical protein [Solirubrobacterales bacterium]